MSKVHIITDSASSLQSTAAERLGITVLPLIVHLEGKDYQDGKDLDREELLMRMTRDRVRPRIVGPTADDFRQVYSQLTRHTNQIISIHSSASLSPVYQEAQSASREFLGRCDILVMDSETLSLGQTILVQEAARLANQDTTLGDITRQIRGIVRRIYIVLITDTLDYLKYNGLINSTQAILGAMLGIKPFLAIEEGELVPMEKVRSRERAIDKLAEFANEFSDIEQMAILQSTPYPTDETKMLQERLNVIIPNREFPILLYGPLLAAQIGPDGMGLVVYEGVSPGAHPY